MNEILRNEIIQWFKEQGWEIDTTQWKNEFLAHHLETVPYLPHMLVEKDGQRFLVAIFEKEEFRYFVSKKQQLTGMDYYKYDFLRHIEAVLNIPVAIVMKEDETNNIIFKPLGLLVKPYQWFKDFNICPKHKLDYWGCWREHSWAVAKHKKGKRKPMAMWPVTEFSDQSAYIPKLC